MASNYSSNPERALPADGSMPGQQRPMSNDNQTPPSSQAALPDTERNRDPRRLASGTVLSDARYKIERLIAAGGMGAVYRAIDTRFNRPCAVKEMLDEFKTDGERAQAVEWFSREATLLLDLNHPCIPRVRDFFAEQGRNYLVMDFIDGYTLSDKLESVGNVVGNNGARGISEADARIWARQVCSVLSYLHQQDPPIIFRDLKPSNIMVTDRNEIKLIDFGIARPFQSQNQATVIMTLGYAPPEQLHGMPEPRSDIYALGATIFRLLTRHDATNNKPSIFSFPPLLTLRPDVSAPFAMIIMRALEPNIQQRWNNAEDMERALINLPPVTVVPPVVKSGPNWAATQLATPAPAHTPSVPVSGSGQGQVPLMNEPMHNEQSHFTSASPSTISGPAGQYITSALRHLVEKRTETAYEAVKYAHGLEPQNAIVHKLFGQVFARRNPPQVDLALQAYNRSLQLNPNDAETHKLIGDVWLFLRQQPLQAISSYQQSLRLSPNDFESHDRLGQSYDKTNQFELAVREYQEAVRLAAQQPEIVRLRLYFSLGQLAFRANQSSVAEHALVQVLILNPADHQARFLLGQVYEREGKFEDAFRECGYVMNGPMGNNPGVQQLYYRLKSRLGR